MRVKNVSDSIVTLPHNDPEDLCSAAMQAGVKALLKTSFCAGNESLVAAMSERPDLFVCPGSWRGRLVEIQPGQEGDIDPKVLMPRAKAVLESMTRPGGSLIVCS